MISGHVDMWNGAVRALQTAARLRNYEPSKRCFRLRLIYWQWLQNCEL